MAAARPPVTGCRFPDGCEAEPDERSLGRFCSEHFLYYGEIGLRMGLRNTPAAKAYRDAHPEPVEAEPDEVEPVAPPASKPKPKPTAPPCVVEGCAKPSGHGADGDLCYRHRGGVDAVVCAWPGCERRAGTGNTRCKEHPLYRFPEAVAA